MRAMPHFDRPDPRPPHAGHTGQVPKAIRRRFTKFLLILALGVVTMWLTVRIGLRPTPESVRDMIQSLGMVGPLLYLLVFFIRPIFLIPSVLLFLAAGLAYGPFWGPLLASVGAAGGGALGFWIARSMGRDYVIRKLKFGAQTIHHTHFSFVVVWLLSLFPVMPVTAINYGAGLSHMPFLSYWTAHVLGLTPRAFAYGFLGHTLLEIGSPRFQAAVLILVVLSGATYLLKRYFQTVRKNAQHPPILPG
ncbi:MAG: TVP38/TMEM64 family protein [Nitrospirae bacterium]|nr:MAG: TVP38/TMEM64 family protein [Nitrospirota bacterium]